VIAKLWRRAGWRDRPIRMGAWRCVVWVVLAGALTAVSPSMAEAQAKWSVDLGGERSPVTIDGVDAVWTAQRLLVGRVDPDKGGGFASVERQARFGRVDVVLAGNGYRRLGAWTVAGGAAATPDAEFWFRWSADGELSRTLVGTLVGSVAVRHIQFVTTSVDQVQPAVTWYHRRGELGARLFVTRNQVRAGTSLTGLAQGSVELMRRIRLAGGVARGDRIFDIASLSTGPAQAWMARGSLRIGIGGGAAVEVGVGFAHENPAFDQRTFTVGLRRVF